MTTTRPRKPPATPKPPAGLSTEARALWNQTLSEYDFSTAADLTLLSELCSALDGVRSCQRQVKKDGMTTLGAGGQIRAHPLLTAEAEYRRQLFAACRALRLTSSMEL